MKRTIFISILACLLLTSCSKSFKDFKIESFEIIQLKADGGSAARAVVELGLDNPISPFELSGINTAITIDGIEYARLTTDPSEKVIVSKGKQKQHFSVDVAMGDVNPFLILNVLKTTQKPSLKLDIEANAALRGGVGTKIKLSKDISDKDLGAFIKKYLVGMEFDKVLKDLKVKKITLQGSVSDFDIVNVTTEEGRSFEAEIRLGLNLKNVPLKDGLVLHDLLGSLNLDGESIATLSSKERQSLEELDKLYTIIVKGEMNEDYNPCMLLSFLEEEKPRLSFEGTLYLDYGGKHKFSFSVPKKK